MAKNVPWHLTIDWKSATGILVVLAILAVVVFALMFKDIQRKTKLANFQGETSGFVTKIEENERMSQDQEGNRIYVQSLTINYYYHVDGKRYNGRDVIDATPNNVRALDALLKDGNDELRIRFDEERPERSLVLLEN